MMIDLAKFTEEEIKELKIMFGVPTPWEKAAYFRHLFSDVQIPAENDRVYLRKRMEDTAARLTDYVTRNYQYGRINKHIGAMCSGIWEDKYIDNYEKFANELVALIKKHLVLEEWELKQCFKSTSEEDADEE